MTLFKPCQTLCFWDMIQYNLLDTYQRCRATFSFHLWGRKASLLTHTVPHPNHHCQNFRPHFEAWFYCVKKMPYSHICVHILANLCMCIYVNGFVWSRGSVLACGTQVHGFKPGRSRRIFRAKKSSSRLPSEGK